MCKVSTCKKILKIAGGLTKGPHSHLLSKHQFKIISQSQAPSLSTRASSSKDLEEEPQNKKPKIMNYFSTSKKEENLSEANILGILPSLIGLILEPTKIVQSTMRSKSILKITILIKIE